MVPLRFLLTALLLSLSAPALAQAQDPAQIVTAIYKRAADGAGDSGGQFLWLKPQDRARSMSKSLVALWARADRHARKGELGAIDFDPVTNSQDPSVGAFEVKVEKQTPKTATVAAIFSSRAEPNRRPDTVRYDLVLENGVWKVDDIRGRIQTPWSVRKLLAAFLKF